MPYYVQVYKSTDLNAPPLSGQVGSSLVVLNACLVDGYGWSGMSITGITRSSQTATATVSAANGLKLRTGMILTISGAGETEYNITATITVASTTTFTYTVSGTPTTPATGTIVASSYLPITSITRGGTGNLTATATLTNANTSLVTGNWLTISGCSGTGAAQYNGTFQITKLSATSFTYQMSADPTASASGSPVYAKAGLQWTRPFSAGTNSQTYLSQATVGALSETYYPRYLQVVDNGVVTAYQSEVYGAELMSADQTVTSGMFPTTAQRAANGIFKKATAANTTVREWYLWGDEKTFTLGAVTGDFTGLGPDSAFTFGYFIPVKSGDKYNTMLLFSSGNASNKYVTPFCANNLAQTITATTYSFGYAPRGFYQVGGSTTIWQTVPYSTSTNLVVIGNTVFMTFPNAADNGLYVQPIYLCDTAGYIRGRVPGLYSSLHGSILSNEDTVTNVVGLPDKTLLCLLVNSLSTVGCAFIDTTGPWE